jgi:H+/Cl- antiporter ClcA
MSTNGPTPPDDASKSLGDIVADVSEKASLLVRQEIELAKAEISDKVGKLAKGAAIAGAAGVFLVFAITMFFHGLAWFLNDVFGWNEEAYVGFGVVTLALVLLALLAAFIAFRLFKKGAPPTPDMAIEEARRTRADLEAQKVQRDQLERGLERGDEVKA